MNRKICYRNLIAIFLCLSLIQVIYLIGIEGRSTNDLNLAHEVCGTVVQYTEVVIADGKHDRYLFVNSIEDELFRFNINSGYKISLINSDILKEGKAVCVSYIPQHLSLSGHFITQIIIEDKSLLLNEEVFYEYIRPVTFHEKLLLAIFILLSLISLRLYKKIALTINPSSSNKWTQPIMLIIGMLFIFLIFVITGKLARIINIQDQFWTHKVLLTTPNKKQCISNFKNIENEVNVASITPDLKGYGNMPNLHTAMELDRKLKSRVFHLINNTKKDNWFREFDCVLFSWAKVENISIEQIDSSHVLNVNHITGNVDFLLAEESFSLAELGLIQSYSNIYPLKLGDGQWYQDEKIVTTGGFYRQALEEIRMNLFVKFFVNNGLIADSIPGSIYDPETDLIYLPFDIKTNLNEFIYSASNDVKKSNKKVLSKIFALVTIKEVSKLHFDESKLNVIHFLTSLSPKAVLAITPYSNLINTLYENVVFSHNPTSTHKDDILIGLNNDDVINAGRGNDFIFSGVGNDTVMVSAYGSNKIDGGNDDDHLVVQRSASFNYNYYIASKMTNEIKGGKGNDVLEGASSADTYIFNIGNGMDVINDFDKHDLEAKDRILFGQGISLDDLRIRKDGDDLVIIIGSHSVGDKITIENAYKDERYRIEEIVLSNNLVISGHELFNLPMLNINDAKIATLK